MGASPVGSPSTTTATARIPQDVLPNRPPTCDPFSHRKITGEHTDEVLPGLCKIHATAAAVVNLSVLSHAAQDPFGLVYVDLEILVIQEGLEVLPEDRRLLPVGDINMLEDL